MMIFCKEFELGRLLRINVTAFKRKLMPRNDYAEIIAYNGSERLKSILQAPRNDTRCCITKKKNDNQEKQKSKK